MNRKFYFKPLKKLFAICTVFLITGMSSLKAQTYDPGCTVDPQLINFNDIELTDAPSGSVIEWHISDNPNAATLISSGTVWSSPTPTNYWAFYHNTSLNTYTLITKTVVVMNDCCEYSWFNLAMLATSHAPAGTIVVYYDGNNPETSNEVNIYGVEENGVYWPFYYDNVNDCFSPAGTPVIVAIDDDCSTGCYKPGLTSGGTILDTQVGITSLGRAGVEDEDNWPMVRKGGWIALESKTKAFVPNRVEFDNLTGNPTGIPEADFVEGMMVYDTTNNCMKIYTSTDNGNTFAWYCISAPACPDEETNP